MINLFEGKYYYFRYLYIAILYTYIIYIHSIQPETPIIISIGHTCATASMIKYFNLRHSSYPFDWLITDLNGIINAIDSNFNDLININNEYLKDITEYSTPLKIDPIPGRMGHIKYNFIFIHDFTVNLNHPAIINQLIKAKDRYTRRFSRFIEAIQSGNKIFLIRWNNCIEASINTTKYTYIQLRDLLNSKFPNNNITIIAVDQKNEYLENWNLNQIKNYYMPYYKESAKAHNLWIPILYAQEIKI